ncbi:MFS transporter [Sphaerimonospora sp. CA-214678]|uniref:MFS transporter n=1 Tax=Sphaerimonospora sp. CA-214678 TaxID=3240029 RepID=UPI003D905C52
MSGQEATESRVSEEKPRQRSVLFRNRDFRWLWSGETVSLLGSEVSVIALPSLAVLAFGEGALAVGLLMALQWIPFVVLGPIFGVITDRMRRRFLMQLANIARFVILGSLPLAAVLDQLTLTHLYIAALLKGIFDVVFQLAYQAYLPQVLDRADLIDGNAKTQISRSLALILGRSFGGGLVSLVGAARAILLDAVSYLIAGITLSFIRMREPEPAPSNRGIGATLRDAKDGAVMTFGNRMLRYLTLMSTFGNIAVSMCLAMVIVFAYQDLGFSAAQVGLALGLGGVTVMLGAILAGKINERLGMGRTLVFTHILLGVALLLLPLATIGGTGWAFGVIVASQCLASFTTPIGNVGIMTLIQKATPPAAMGRVAGVALPFVWGAHAAGPLLGSAIAAVFATSVVFVAGSALAFCAVFWIVLGSVHRLTDDVPEDLRVVVV